MNKSVERSRAQQETATSCGDVGLQDIVSTVRPVVFNRGLQHLWGSFTFFLWVARASDKNIHNYFLIISYINPLSSYPK